MDEIEAPVGLPESPRGHWWIELPDDPNEANPDDKPPTRHREGLWVIDDVDDVDDQMKVWDAPEPGTLS